MGKNENSEPTPAEEFLTRMNPDRPFRRKWRYIPSRSDIDPDWRYKPVWGKHRLWEKFRIVDFSLFMAVVAIGLWALVEGVFFHKSVYMLMILCIALSVILVASLAVRDATKGKKSVEDFDESSEVDASDPGEAEKGEHKRKSYEHHRPSDDAERSIPEK